MIDNAIWCAALALMQRHGADAVPVAVKLAAQMRTNGNAAGRLAWKRMAMAIRELQRLDRQKNETLN